MSPLSLSVVLPTTKITPQDVRSYSTHAEQLEFDAVFVGDHLAPSVPILESTLTLATAAAATRHLRVGFGVMILALRHPVWAARQIATLQQLSNDRVILGVGTGGKVHGTAAWDAVGVPWSQRGRRTDDALGLLPGLIGGKPTELIPERPLTLLPVTQMPPVWIGGSSSAALRRSVEQGDAWFPSMLTLDQLRHGNHRLTELAQAQGRQRPTIAVGGATLLHPTARPATPDAFIAGLHNHGLGAEDAAQVPIIGTPRHAAERFEAYRRVGAEHLVLGIIDGDWRRQCELIAQARALLD